MYAPIREIHYTTSFCEDCKWDNTATRYTTWDENANFCFEFSMYPQRLTRVSKRLSFAFNYRYNFWKHLMLPHTKRTSTFYLFFFGRKKANNTRDVTRLPTRAPWINTSWFVGTKPQTETLNKFLYWWRSQSATFDHDQHEM